MAKISLARLDARMIHGAVIATWVPFTGANLLVAVDDLTAADDFIVQIMKNCAVSIRAEVYSAAKFADMYTNGVFRDRNILVVFKSVEMVYKTVKAGVQIDSLQLGYTAPSNAATIIIDPKYLRLSPKELDYLKLLRDEFNMNIYIQYTPKETSKPFTSWDAK